MTVQIACVFGDPGDPSQLKESEKKMLLEIALCLALGIPRETDLEDVFNFGADTFLVRKMQTGLLFSRESCKLHTEAFGDLY